MFYIAESDGKVHGTHPKLKKHTQIIYFSSTECQGSRPQGRGSSIYSLTSPEAMMNKKKNFIINSIYTNNIFFIFILLEKHMG